jgi:hypothetical protein
MQESLLIWSWCGAVHCAKNKRNTPRKIHHILGICIGWCILHGVFLLFFAQCKAAHPREHDADVQAPPHHLHERITHLLEALWAAMVKVGCALGERRFTTARRVTDHSSSMEAGAEIFKDFTDLRGKRNLKR